MPWVPDALCALPRPPHARDGRNGALCRQHALADGALRLEQAFVGHEHLLSEARRSGATIDSGERTHREA